MKLFSCLLIAASCCGIALAQTPTPEQVITEEIRIPVAALDRSGSVAAELGIDDVVISEDGRLHQPSSVLRTPASVLIALDTGGTIRQQKNLATTRSVASALAGDLRIGTHFAVIQSHDRVDRLQDWTSDKSTALTAIDKKTNFGRRSSFTLAIGEAEKILKAAPTENRHLVLITDGVDTIENEPARAEAIRRLWQSGVAVHVISYTLLEMKSQNFLGRLVQKGQDNPRRMPEEVLEQLIYALPVKKTVARDILRQIYQPRLISIIIDPPFLKAQRNQSKALATSQIQLAVLSEHTGGEFFLPDSLDEMTEHARVIARRINSQYVVTYSPKRPLKDVKDDEIRQVEVTSRRPDIDARASRRLVVFARGETN